MPEPDSWGEAGGAELPSYPGAVFPDPGFYTCVGALDPHMFRPGSGLPLSNFFPTYPILWASPHMSVYNRCCFQMLQVRNVPLQNCNMSLTFLFRIILFLDCVFFPLSVTSECAVSLSPGNPRPSCGFYKHLALDISLLCLLLVPFKSELNSSLPVYGTY